jgi:hypothetical protein
MSSNQRPDTLMQDRIIQIDKSSCTARPDHTCRVKAEECAHLAKAAIAEDVKVGLVFQHQQSLGALGCHRRERSL